MSRFAQGETLGLSLDATNSGLDTGISFFYLFFVVFELPAQLDFFVVTLFHFAVVVREPLNPSFFQRLIISLCTVSAPTLNFFS